MITLIVCAYRNEDVIADAISGAFAQTYPALEIILSDDCSSDGTYATMERMAASYEGPHVVRTNRNASNVGVGEHLNILMQLSRGDLVVMNAGDDISRPDRVAKIAEKWAASGTRAHLIHSAALLIAADRTPKYELRPESIMRNNPSAMQLAASGAGTIGATQAWTRQLFERFGPLHRDVQCEDHILPFRASLIGEVAYVDEPLVEYREGGMSSQFYTTTGREVLYGTWLKWLRWWRDGFQQMIRDLERFEGHGKAELLSTCREQLAQFEAPLELASLPYVRRFSAARRLLRNRDLKPRFKALNLLKYLAPWFYSAQFDLKRKLHLLP